MRKKIIINIFITITIVTVIALNMFAKNMRQSKIESETSSMQVIIDQMVENIKYNKIKTSEVEKLFTADYLNRARFAYYLLEDLSENDLTKSKWDEIINLVNVNNISQVNSDGIVIRSSNPNSIGLDFHSDDTLKEFLPLIEGKESNGYYVQFNGKSISLNKTMVYIGVEIPEKGGMVQIEVDPVMLENYRELSSIKEFFSTVPTKDYQTLFAINKETKDIIGISKNNHQKIEIENVIESLESAINNPKILIVNGVQQLAVVNEYDDNLVVYLSEISVIDKNLNVELSRVFLLIILLYLITVAVLYIILSELVLDDILKISNNANLLVKGNKDIVFEKGKTKELTELSMQLNKVLNVVGNSVERISSIASLMGQDFEAYEYYSDLNQIFYSKNMLNMMESTEEEYNEIIRSKFNKIHSKVKIENNSFEEQEIIRTSSGRIVKIRRICFKKSMFGFLEDITKEKEMTKKLALKLKEEKENTYIDDLTGLYNRKKIREYITTLLNNKNSLQGFVILLDLDNFKRVNDELGHLEGDILLNKFSDLLRKEFDDASVIARLGGDEFVIVIQNLTNEDDLSIKLNKFIKETRKELHKYYLRQRLSVSMGVVSLNESLKSFEEIYKCADSAMYITKRHGKDGFHLNKENNLCMQEDCVDCKKYCERRKLLFGSEK